MNDAAQPFRYEVESEQEGTTVLRLYGELDMGTASDLKSVLHEVQHGSTDDVLIDLRGLTFLDSMGLSALMEAHKAGQNEHRTVSFVAGGRTVHKVFQVTKMDERVTWVEPENLDRPESV